MSDASVPRDVRVGTVLCVVHDDVTILYEDLPLIHQVVEHKEPDQRSPSYSQSGIAFVLQCWRVAVAPLESWVAPLQISELEAVGILELRTVDLLDELAALWSDGQDQHFRSASHCNQGHQVVDLELRGVQQ